MRPEARQTLRDLQWLTNAETYLAQAREDLSVQPDNQPLRALVRMIEELIGQERRRLLPPICVEDANER